MEILRHSAALNGCGCGCKGDCDRVYAADLQGLGEAVQPAPSADCVPYKQVDGKNEYNRNDPALLTKAISKLTPWINRLESSAKKAENKANTLMITLVGIPFAQASRKRAKKYRKEAAFLRERRSKYQTQLTNVNGYIQAYGKLPPCSFSDSRVGSERGDETAMQTYIMYGAVAALLVGGGSAFYFLAKRNKKGKLPV